MINPIIVAVIAAIRTDEAVKSLIFLIVLSFSILILLQINSIAELIISVVKTKAIAKIIKHHSIGLILKKIDKKTTKKEKNRCILELRSLIKKNFNPLKANEKLLKRLKKQNLGFSIKLVNKEN